MRIAFGSDHAGLTLRTALEAHAAQEGHHVESFGAQTNSPYDYPDAADLVCQKILAGEADLGVLICGSGIGISIRANRHAGIRAANCCSPEMARLARLHNHANILAMGERLIDEDLAIQTLDAFLDTAPDLDERHVRRVRKLDSHSL
jgi:ribose 5-phosphate isomerase B